MVSQQCKEIAKAFDCAFLLAAQLSRSLESRQDKRPILSDLRDSGEIEENADVVLMIYRESYYNPPIVQPKLDATEVWVRKFRDGPGVGLMNLQFDAREQWFYSKDR
jgi:replicative DNA helicase